MEEKMIVDEEMLSAYRSDGVVLIRGLFRDWVEIIKAGIERNMASPGPFASENSKEGQAGLFFDDYCNWTRIEEFEDVIRNSPVASVAAKLMDSETVQIFHDHVLVKEPGTTLATPWHQDSPYYFVDGKQNISFWCPVDPVKEATLRLVAGSHLWEMPVLPTRWASETDFYPNENIYMPVPDPDAEGMQILEWEMEPGDAVAFHYKTLHGARGNLSGSRRRAFSIRFVGDDARYVTRAGKTSPPYPGHDMKENQRLREDWFPVIYSRSDQVGD